MNKELGPGPPARAAPLDPVKQSVHSDLQYISIQVDGQTYGGWYRVLTDGQMELLALANMHCERRFENTPTEQARGMLTDFIRVARPSRVTGDDRHEDTGTLGALLYADKTKTRVAEKDWGRLLQSIAAGDRLALRELYERTHHLVFTLFVRLTGNRKAAEALTLEVFHDAWRRAAEYDAEDGSVVGWIMNRARSKALDQARFEPGKKRVDTASVNATKGSPPDVLRPSQGLWARVAQRIAAATGGEPVSCAASQWQEPEWEEVAPGIACKLLATDAEKHSVSMLVRLAPGIEYPPHRHAGVEELHLLHGELVINDRKLHAGEYNRAEPGSADRYVWSGTGCTCVLVTSSRDEVG